MATRKIAKPTIGGKAKITARKGTVRGAGVQAGSGRVTPTRGPSYGGMPVQTVRTPTTPAVTTGKTPLRSPGRQPTRPPATTTGKLPLRSPGRVR